MLSKYQKSILILSQIFLGALLTISTSLLK